MLSSLAELLGFYFCALMSVVRADHVHAVLQASSCRPESVSEVEETHCANYVALVGRW